MDTKLTLKLDKEVIAEAKVYAASQKKSLSRLIEGYLQSLVSQHRNESATEIELSPFVKSIASGINIPADLDYKTKYLDRVAEKYK
jgi:hypothetical protein